MTFDQRFICIWLCELAKVVSNLLNGVHDEYMIELLLIEQSEKKELYMHKQVAYNMWLHRIGRPCLVSMILINLWSVRGTVSETWTMDIQMGAMLLKLPVQTSIYWDKSISEEFIECVVIFSFEWRLERDAIARGCLAEYIGWKLLWDWLGYDTLTGQWNGWIRVHFTRTTKHPIPFVVWDRMFIAKQKACFNDARARCINYYIICDVSWLVRC